MKITGKREKKVYATEHKEETVTRKVFFNDAFRTKPELKVSPGFEVQLDQAEAPFVSCHVSKHFEADIDFASSPKTLREDYTLEVKGYK